MKKTETPSWDTVLLACRECSRRSSGPRDLSAKDVVGELRHAARAERPRPRVLVSGCLGLCPKKAVAVARVGAGQVRLLAVKSKKQAAVAADLLKQQDPAGG